MKIYGDIMGITVRKNNKYVTDCDTGRLTLDNYFIDVCKVISSRSICPSGKKHGAVAVKDGRILSTGYNGPPSGYVHCNPCTLTKGGSDRKDWSSCPAVHAELNVILNAAKWGISLKDSTVYLTKKPCSQCFSGMINAGIKEVVYEED